MNSFYKACLLCVCLSFVRSHDAGEIRRINLRDKTKKGDSIEPHRNQSSTTSSIQNVTTEHPPVPMAVVASSPAVPLADVTSASHNFQLADKTSTSPEFPLAALFLVDAEGTVIEKISTNQKIRLKVQALTTPKFQSPFVHECWYTQYTEQPKTKPSSADPQTTFLERGCTTTASKLKLGKTPFEGNGILDVQTDLFDLMPLYDEEFSFLKFECEVYLCHADAVCSVVCPALRTNTWKMDKDAVSLTVENTVEVVKVKPTTTAATVVNDDSKMDNIIRGGRKYYEQQPKPVNEPFLKKNQHYFVISCLSVTALLLLAALIVGYLYFSRRNNEASRSDINPFKQNIAADFGKGIYDDYSGDNPGFVTSPPPAYNKGSIWTTPKSNLRSPTAGLLEPRQFPKQTSAQRHSSVQRRLELETVQRGDSDNENGGMRSQCDINEMSERYRDVTRSPVGGEWYHGRSGRHRSSSQERDGQSDHTPSRRADRSALINAALKEYFEKYGM